MSRHIGAICDPSPSHVMGIAAIGRALQKRGYAFTLFQTTEAEPYAEGISFRAIHVSKELTNDRRNNLAELSSQRGVSIRGTNKGMVQSARVICEGAPDLVRSAQVDLLLADQSEPGASIVADSLGIPFVTVCNTVPLNRDDAIPPCFLPWQYDSSRAGRLRNRIAYKVRDVVLAPVFKVLNHYRKLWNLPIYKTPDDSFSRLAQITQLIEEFDLPHANLPECFHYVGPYQEGQSPRAEFNWSWLDGRPLIYISLGTIMGGNAEMIRTIAQSCLGLDAQIVVALGGRGRMEEHSYASKDILVVSYAPQRELLKRAKLVITHAGLNTVMEALQCGLPLVAIPITFDQPGVAARIKYSGVGESVPLAQCHSDKLRSVVTCVWRNESYREEAAKLKTRMAAYRGSEAAADIIEQVLETRKPVTRNGFVNVKGGLARLPRK